MLYILIALFFFLDAVVIHIVLCRRKKEEGLFLKLFFVVAFINMMCMGFVFWAVSQYFFQGREGIFGMPLFATATVLYIFLIPTYLIFYFSTQQVSPSKKILLLLAEGPKSSEELSTYFSNEEFVFPRIQDLIVTRCVLEHNGWYVLTPSGVQMAGIYQAYQAVLGRKKGG